MEGQVQYVQRIGVIGDVHGEDAALEAALTFLRNNVSLDAILCTGDVPGKHGVGDTERCCRLLTEAGTYTIRGNHDRWAVENESIGALIKADEPANVMVRNFLHTLPKTIALDTPRGKLLLCHGLGDDDMAGIYPGGEDEPILRALKERRIYLWYRLVVAGHTHRRMVRAVGTVTLLNAGTLRWEEQPGFLTADFEDGTVQFYDLAPFTNQISAAERYDLSAPSAGARE